MSLPALSYNPAHHHSSPLDSNQWLRELVRKVRAAMDEVNPQALLNTEAPIDYLHEYCDASLQMFQPGRDIDAMRVALPTYAGLSYHPGAVESALNGWVGGKTTARRVEWPWAHRGLAGRPATYGPGPGPELRWHELRASFAEAVSDGTVALADPEAADAPRWVGRLWRGRRFWLMVGGSEDGTPFSGEVRANLPELPPQIRQGWEFDAATLKMRDARLLRDSGVLSVVVSSGLGAVLLPMPGCPPLLRLDKEILSVRAGEAAEIHVSAFAPWREDRAQAVVAVSSPGLLAVPARVKLPGRIRLHAPKDAEPGWYPLKLTGNCLPLKRWVRVEP